MGKIIVTNNDLYRDTLDTIYRHSGLENSVRMLSSDTYISTYKKKRVDTCNFYINKKSKIYAVGTYIYESKTGTDALQIMLNDFEQYHSINKIKDKLIGSCAVCIEYNNKIYIFIDASGTYNLYYYNREGKYLLTNMFYHIQKCVHDELDKIVFLEYNLTFSIIDNKTPWQNIYRLMENEIIEINQGDFQIVNDDSLNNFLYKVGGINDVANDIVSSVKQLNKAICNNYNKCAVSITGGRDSRFVLAAHTSMGNVPDLFYWYGDDGVSNGCKDDIEIGKQLSGICNTKFYTFNITQDWFENIKKLDVEVFEKYGEYSYFYGANEKWFHIFEKDLTTDFVNAGYFGETIAGWDDLNKKYHENFSLNNFVDEIYLNRFVSYQEVENYNVLRNRIIDEFKYYCNLYKINYNNLSKENCMNIYYRYRMHADIVICNFFNIFYYSTPILAQRCVRDITFNIPYSFMDQSKLYLLCMKKMDHKLLSIKYFSHGKSQALNNDNEIMEDSHAFKRSGKFKAWIRKRLYSWFGEDKGALLLYKLGILYYSLSGNRIMKIQKQRDKEIIKYCKKYLKDFYKYLPIIWKNDASCVASLHSNMFINCLIIDSENE